MFSLWIVVNDYYLTTNNIVVTVVSKVLFVSENENFNLIDLSSCISKTCIDMQAHEIAKALQSPTQALERPFFP